MIALKRRRTVVKSAVLVETSLISRRETNE